MDACLAAFLPRRTDVVLVPGLPRHHEFGIRRVDGRAGLFPGCDGRDVFGVVLGLGLTVLARPPLFGLQRSRDQFGLGQGRDDIAFVGISPSGRRNFASMQLVRVEFGIGRVHRQDVDVDVALVEMQHSREVDALGHTLLEIDDNPRHPICHDTLALGIGVQFLGRQRV
ncbi:hypothetical protein [Paracoccus yeei]|uniref:Uncharacterized protein n=1 Tax=Paracoccus yeei TaxID=147645 RepID=A0A2D2C1N0_9RHOB|nr:hypothetical protein [Paracoccus yeei]ATQ56418.1 hypothetical protein PYTT13_11795 [Paracoccus yeei]